MASIRHVLNRAGIRPSGAALKAVVAQAAKLVEAGMGTDQAASVAVSMNIEL